ncbi:MAG: GtrA family protein [Muribaculaceae bacterium]|nr:GtrA family protein [Muribaculaceae bacterium]
MVKKSDNPKRPLGERLRSLTWKGLVKKFMNSDGLIATFLRSGVSSQLASIVDLSLGFVLFSWCGFDALIATAIGAIAGGAVNCAINYKFTFHAEGCPWSAVIIKYTMVWVGSLLLNSFGTDWLNTLFENMPWLATLGVTTKGCYAAARLIVSLLVSWFWNFLLQRYFVYVPTRFDKYAVRLFRIFDPHNRADKEDGDSVQQ